MTPCSSPLRAADASRRVNYNQSTLNAPCNEPDGWRHRLDLMLVTLRTADKPDGLRHRLDLFVLELFVINNGNEK